MQVFLKRLTQHREHLSRLEIEVLDFILHYPERMIELNVSQLANELFVSTATISRTCKKLGFLGFQDMKYSINKEVNQERKSTNTTNIGVLAEHLNRMQLEITNTLACINEEEIVKAAKYIKDSNRIEFFGVGNSLPVSIDAARKLMFSGKIASAREDWDELRSVADSLTEKDLAILISYSGETINILAYASILKKRNVKIIAITGQQKNRLQQEADLSIQGYVTSYYFGEVDMSSRFPLSIILDLIILTYFNQFKSK